MAEELDPFHQRVLNEINHDEVGWAVVRIHVRIEAELYRIASEGLPYPDALPKRIPWEAHVRWLTAAGLLDPDLLEPLVKLNTFRNKAAHRVVEEMDVEEGMRQVVHACPAYFFVHEYAANPEEFRFRLALSQLYLAVHNSHHRIRRAADPLGDFPEVQKTPGDESSAD